jgi:hypothetical protein
MLKTIAQLLVKAKSLPMVTYVNLLDNACHTQYGIMIPTIGVEHKGDFCIALELSSRAVDRRILICYDTVVKKAGSVGSPVALETSRVTVQHKKRSDPRRQQVKCIC